MRSVSVFIYLLCTVYGIGNRDHLKKEICALPGTIHKYFIKNNVKYTTDTRTPSLNVCSLNNLVRVSQLTNVVYFTQ